MEATLTEEVTFKDLLLDAAALIEEYGWVQDESGSIDRGFCAVGAMVHASGCRGIDPMVWQATVTHHRATLNKLIDFNDLEGQTQEGVIAELKRAGSRKAD